MPAKVRHSSRCKKLFIVLPRHPDVHPNTAIPANTNSTKLSIPTIFRTNRCCPVES